jgi:competence protein ComEA
MPATRNSLLHDYFTFSKKERRAVLILAVAAVLFALLPVLFPGLVKGESDIIVDDETEKQLAAMRTNANEQRTPTDDEQNTDWYQPKSKTYPQYNSATKGALFVFDPNTATAEEWKRLGIKDKTVQTILNYRSKGGSFKKPEDISRIYGLSAKDVERLLPYVTIENNPASHASPQNTPAATTTEPTFTAKEKIAKPIDINTADTAEWKTLKGIGSFYAKKIVGFREKLGGFHSIQQIAETYGLPDSTFQSIKPYLLQSTTGLKQIDLNAATVEELKVHPYIKTTIAKAIVNYRESHGVFKSVADLQKLGAIDDELFKKIAPYLYVKQ